MFNKFRLPCLRKTLVSSRIFCLFSGHNWSGHDVNICQRCRKKAVGLPKFNSPPPCPPLKPP